MQQMADDVMDSSSGCGKQLSEAWHYMFGRESNYSAASAAFVKTVELCFCKLASTVWALFFGSIGGWFPAETAPSEPAAPFSLAVWS